MSESTTQTATELASQYSVQVASDLERNVKEQERISGEITDLQQQLAALQHDHALLVNMQQALGVTTPPAPSVTDKAPVPAPRDSAAAETAAGSKRTRGGKAVAAPKRAAAAKPATKPAAKSASKSPAKPATKSATKAATKAVRKPVAKKPTDRSTSPAAAVSSSSSSSAAQPAQPTLVELVRKHLSEQKEPRSAAEVTTALGQAHSDRTIKTTVVRTTLEGLVAKNQAQRTKQGTSVYYTASDAPEPKQDDAGAQSGSDRADD
ncbi:hypothetical protein [Streptomyces flaveolus]|uniref:hypothetical protein n=1 Tax=Streptomyces flaveolus TaxID=67297 RepID=UPI0037FFE1FD